MFYFFSPATNWALYSVYRPWGVSISVFESRYVRSDVPNICFDVKYSLLFSKYAKGGGASQRR